VYCVRMKRLARKVLSKAGYVILRASKGTVLTDYPIELSKEECRIIDSVIREQLTMVSFERLVATLMACKYVLENSIEGDFVECGVWRGGNAIVAAEMFKLYSSDKHVWLFDTFLGMTQPTGLDTDQMGNLAEGKYLAQKSEGFNNWCYASLEDVTNSFDKRKLLGQNIHFIKGDVTETLKTRILPTKISVLRLDTDWYESTKVECQVLYPKLSIGGCFVIDDYGHWNGSRFAVDEYFKEVSNRPFLHATDYTGRIGVKTT
jgi:O-methyltransferase